jgi:hypothetical protein
MAAIEIYDNLPDITKGFKDGIARTYNPQIPCGN